jgi:ABC-2 type transport system permease protein
VSLTPAGSPTGAVYDRGYRPYDGPRGGRSAARAAVWRLSVRRALGLRRTWRQKVFPWTLLAIATMPAVVNVGIGYLTRDSPLEDFSFFTYREYVGVSSALLLFVALTAPDVVCPDRRNRVLPLIFARQLDGRDYVVAKVGAIAFIVFGFAFLPHVVLFAGQMIVTRGGSLTYLRANAEVLWQVPLAVVVLALFHASVGVALAATTGRRVVGGVTLLALYLVTSTVAGVLVGVANEGRSSWGLLNMVALPLHVRDLIFLGNVDPEGPLGGVRFAGLAAVALYLLIVGTSLAYLLRRYREVGPA